MEEGVHRQGGDVLAGLEDVPWGTLHHVLSWRVSDPDDAHAVARALLSLAFPTHAQAGTAYSRSKIEYWDIRGLPKPVRTLTPAQRAALEAIVASDVLFAAQTNLYALYGLPTSRDALRALLLQSERE